jgi:cobalt-zinc-cadmium efflux system protein
VVREANHTRGDDVARLNMTLVASGLILVVEFVGAVLSHSIALYADAAHMITDVGAVALALWAARLAARPPDAKRTFGYGRSKVLAAFVNGAALFAIVVFLVIEAVSRLRSPSPVDQGIMLWIAAFALAANVAVSRYVGHGHSHAGSINVRAVVWHLYGDALASGGVILAAIMIKVTGLLVFDPLVSLAIALIVAYSAYSLVRDSANVLMEGAPYGLSVQSVRDLLADCPQVTDIHDVHVWSLGEDQFAAAMHIKLQSTQLAESPKIVAHVKDLLKHTFRVAHSTIEVECDDCGEACD